ncbi:hypothetical protein UF75_3767 [Desulfosporosinus sp. I2]|nr:hypothetical protein UF75_3767 [Desulfosporosinus sp. I2]
MRGQHETPTHSRNWIKGVDVHVNWCQNIINIKFTFWKGSVV